MRVVFTGPAVGLDGKPILRDDLIKACAEAGHTVMNAVDKNVNVLVASRFDTVKAKNAAKLGIELQTYKHFLTDLLIELGHDIPAADKSKSKGNPYIDGEGALAAEEHKGGYGEGM